ncbi:MAG: hypothetical protein ABGX07_20750 [Pirellulaceae bacterium]
MSDVIISWTIRFALLLLWFAWWLRLKRAGRAAACCFFASWCVYACHVLAAFHWVHDWSHRHAVEHTAEVSRRITGISAGFGIYFNHLLMVVWLWIAWDAWQQTGSESSSSRSTILRRCALVYLIFMVIQGAILFAPLGTAVVTTLMLAGLTYLTLKNRRSAD